jgi:hypothetical protein
MLRVMGLGLDGGALSSVRAGYVAQSNEGPLSRLDHAWETSCPSVLA